MYCAVGAKEDGEDVDFIKVPLLVIRNDDRLLQDTIELIEILYVLYMLHIVFVNILYISYLHHSVSQ
eukprot:m.1644379 g.1644379  ORF g.1644379 m.1644379 type:complete len:67 (-) comp62881_c0_seq1:52-252(-)